MTSDIERQIAVLIDQELQEQQAAAFRTPQQQAIEKGLEPEKEKSELKVARGKIEEISTNMFSRGKR